jgi:hypothetical protein
MGERPEDSDLVAGVVLAAILVPQGMAYAELAGLPPGHRALHDDRLPGRLRHLRPEPRARAGPRLVGVAPDLRRHHPAARRRRRPCRGDRVGRHARRARRCHRDRPRIGQARLRRRPALQGGAGRLHERAGDHDHRRPAPEALRVLHRRRRLRRRDPAVRDRPRRAEPPPRSCWAPRCSRPVDPPPIHPRDPRGARRRRRRHRRLGRASISPPTASPSPASLPQGVPTPVDPVDERRRRRPAAAAAVGITLVSLTDTIATATSFAARRGDEVDPTRRWSAWERQHRRRGASRLRHLDQRLTHRRGRAGRCQDPGDRPGRRRRGRAAAARVQRSLLADLPQTALAAVVIAAALSLMDVACSAATPRVRRSASSSRWSPAVGVDLLRCAAGHRGRRRALDPAVLPSQLVAPRRGARRVEDLDGWHSIDRYPEAEEDSRRRRLPLGGTAVLRQLRHLPRQVRRLVRDREPEMGGPAVRGDHRRRRHRGRHAEGDSTRSSTRRACTSRSSSSAPAP